MDVKLVIEQGSDASKVFRLRSAETVIGRQSDCGLRIPSSAVSRKHCRLIFRDDVLMVEDLESANGTQVNDEIITGQRVLRPGDRLAVGPVTFVVKYQLTPAAIERLLADSQAEDQVDVEPAEETGDIPELDVEQLADTDEVPAMEKPPIEKPAARGKTPPKPAAKKTQQLKKKPVRRAAKPHDDALDPDVAAMLDGEKSWHMPANDDFRDFLSQLEDG